MAKRPMDYPDPAAPTWEGITLGACSARIDSGTLQLGCDLATTLVRPYGGLPLQASDTHWVGDHHRRSPFLGLG